MLPTKPIWFSSSLYAPPTLRFVIFLALSGSLCKPNSCTIYMYQPFSVCYREQLQGFDARFIIQALCTFTAEPCSGCCRVVGLESNSLRRINRGSDNAEFRVRWSLVRWSRLVKPLDHNPNTFDNHPRIGQHKDDSKRVG